VLKTFSQEPKNLYVTNCVTQRPVFEDLGKGHSLRDLIQEVLRQGPASISQLAKKLKEPYNVELHRLALAGYLKALADLGVLDEREIPPAKVYQLRPTQQRQTVYDAVAARIRELSLSEAEAGRLYVQVLHDLFHRPIFREELRRGGFDHTPILKEATAEERQAARRLFSRSTLKLPFNDPAYHPDPGTSEAPTALREASRHLLGAIVRAEFGANALAQTTRQATLGGA
jgi:hypothetical protein